MKTYTLQELGHYLSAEVIGDPSYSISAVAALDQALPNQISFYANADYRDQLNKTRAGAVILTAAARDLYSGHRLVFADPQLGVAKLTTLLGLGQQATKPLGIHPTAVVDPSCIIHPTASIGPYCVLEEGVQVGEHSQLDAGCVVGRDSILGAFCRLYPRVVLYHDVQLGDRVIVHSGAVIGSDGFGYAQEHKTWIKIPQIGGVRIGDDVEIGANTAVDRGALGHTHIGSGVKIDNLVQVAHNVRIGAHTIIAGCVSIAGSVEIGMRCQFGGGVGIRDHVKIVDDVAFAGMSVVAYSVTHSGQYATSTYKQMPVLEAARCGALYAKLPQLDKRIKQLEARE